MALITASDINTLARPCYADDTKAARFIDEAEQQDLRQRLGDRLYSYIVSNTEALTDLLDGCTYTAGGEERTVKGLKTALAYYTYSRIVVGGNIEVTRVGVVARDSQYSERSDYSERLQVSRETAAIADYYMSEVLDYCRADATLRLLMRKQNLLSSNRTKFKIAGK